MKITARHHLARLSVLAALMLSLVPAAALRSQPVQAEGRRIEQTDQTSADANEEIVYVDSSGFIRVLDPQDEAVGKVQWVSADGGWRTMALGDFDADKDLEIVAVKGSGASDSIVAIFDPVVAKGTVVPGQEFNKIPWKEMGRFSLKERPETVAAGNFDVNIPGDEILVARKIVTGEGGSGSNTRIEIFKQTSTAVDGSSWVFHYGKNFDYEIDRTAVANVDAAGGDEVALLAVNTKLEVFQPDQDFRLYEDGSDCRPPKDVTFAQYYAGGPLELLVVRKADCSQASTQNAFQIMTYNATTGYTEVGGELFDPEPSTVFAGDVNGTGDDEAVLLRKVDAGIADAKRMFIRGNGDDLVINDFIVGLPLDKDNLYLEGAAGDIDGDGKDEPVIIRDTNIRWYPNAHNSSLATDFAATTNKRSIAIGDLDKNGANAGPQFATSVSKLDIEAKVGFTTTNSFTLKNGGTEDGLPFFASVDGVPPWLTVSPSTGVAPGKSSSGTSINYTINGGLLTAGLVYSTTLRIQSSTSPVANNTPVLIPVIATAVLPPFEAMPSWSNAFYYPCETAIALREVQFALTGPVGTKLIDASVMDGAAMSSAATLIGDDYLAYRVDDQTLAVVDAAGTWGSLPYQMPDAVTASSAVAASDLITYESAVSWITSISVPTTTLPTVMTVVISPTLPATVTTASLILIGPSNQPNTPIEVRNYSIGLTCVDRATWMPVASKK